MKKIFVVLATKNESDIIESYCRYNLTFCDGMIIYERQSSDNTNEIIRKLIAEGLPIYLYDDPDIVLEPFAEGTVVTAMAYRAINEYGADLVIPLDTDEFLYHTDGINPRETLEALREDVEYQVPWRTYVYEKEPDKKLGFMPNNFTRYRNPVLEKIQGHAGTTFISKYLIQEKRATFYIGAHWLLYPEENKDTIIIENPEKLVCAHFPIRSKEQLLRKTIPNWITKWNTVNRVSRDRLDNFQLGILFNILKNNGDIPTEEMKKHSVDYSIYNISQDVKKIQKTIGNLQEKKQLTKKDPMDVSFFSAKLKLRYTNYKEDNNIFMRAVLTELDKTVTFLSAESNGKSELLKKYVPTSTSLVYFDTGNGFNTEDVLTVPLFRHENYFEAAVNLPPNVKSIRFDPVEDFACILDNVQVITDFGKIEYSPINGIVADGLNIFDNSDPQILIDFKGRIISHIKITGNMRHFIMDDISLLSKTKKVIENLTVERDGLIAERDGLLNSRSWRFTKPLRNFAAFVRRHKILRLFAKGLLSIKRYVVIGTIKNVKDNKKRKSQKPLSLLTLTERLSQESTVFPKKIKISIITPLYNTPEQFLKEVIQSVKEQTYSNWELCLADGSDNKYKNIRRICKKFVKNDKRIKYKRLNNNFGISGNSNKAIEMSSGEYIGILDHDDVLHPSALYEVMKAICNENADFIYTDEATFTNDERKITVKHYKPDYAIDTLRSCNYICHFSVFSRRLTDQTGIFRSEYDGSQDHDLILRYTDIASKIYHIPKVLYFWRSHENSVSSDINNKEYAILAAKKAIEEHINKHGITARVESTNIYLSFYRIKYNLIEKPLVSIIISNKDRGSMSQNCLSSIIEKTTFDNYEIIIVENGATGKAAPEYYKYLKKKPNVHIVNLKKKVVNYGELNNFGVQHARGKHLVFLNNNVEIITPNWIEEMLMFNQRNDVGAVGMKLYFPDNTIQHAGIILGIGEIAGYIFQNVPRDAIGYMARTHIVQNMSAVSAACMMIKRSVFEKAGCFSSEFINSFNDIDLCLKIRQSGYLIVWTPFAEAYNYETKQNDYSEESKDEYNKEIAIFKSKWAKELSAGDPYYNCNFCLDKTDYTIKGEKNA